MRRWGDKKGSAKILVLPHGSGAISKAGYFVRITRSRYNLPQGCVPPLLRHHVVVVYLACVRHLLAWRLHAYLTSGIVTLNSRMIVCGYFIRLIHYSLWHDFCLSYWETMKYIATWSLSQITTQRCQIKTDSFPSFALILPVLCTKRN